MNTDARTAQPRSPQDVVKLFMKVYGTKRMNDEGKLNVKGEQVMIRKVAQYKDRPSHRRVKHLARRLPGGTARADIT